MEKVVVDTPGARCNDGSPPAMYVRKATNPQHADDWVFFVEGGQSCETYEECRERWCSDQHHLMTTKGEGTRRNGTGILSADRTNPFHDWNVVRLNYCSSDQWVGAAPGPVEMSSLANDFTLLFQGHKVMLALLGALDSGATGVDGLRMPQLTDAKRILWAGHSAGGAGAEYHLDPVADRYPRAKVVGIIDSQLYPDKDGFDRESRAIGLEREAVIWERRYHQYWGADWMATPCEKAAKAEPGEGDCQDGYFLWGTYIKSPVVVKVDLRDPVISKLYVPGGVPMVEWTNAIDFTTNELVKLKRDDMSIMQSNCGTHEGLGTDGIAFELTVPDESGERYNVAEIAWRLMMEDKVTIARDTPGGNASHCAPEAGGTKSREPARGGGGNGGGGNGGGGNGGGGEGKNSKGNKAGGGRGGNR